MPSAEAVAYYELVQLNTTILHVLVPSIYGGARDESTLAPHAADWVQNILHAALPQIPQWLGRKAMYAFVVHIASLSFGTPMSCANGKRTAEERLMLQLLEKASYPE